MKRSTRTTQKPDSKSVRSSVRKVQIPHARERRDDLPTLAEIARVVSRLSLTSSTGMRNRALILGGYSAALRLGEALALRPRDLDVKNRFVTIERGKGGRSRRVGIGEQALAAIVCWIERRRTLGIRSNTPLFCSLSGEPLASSYVRALLPRLAREAGVRVRVHFHALRHARALEMKRRGAGDHEIRHQLGHEFLTSTARYLRRVAPEDLRAVTEFDALSSES